ncbi:hypothetical protein J7296_02531 [Nakaseomyces glabratus]|nr:hypothetical protein J7296_02531 [Nakaseomyces glabratus]
MKDNPPFSFRLSWIVSLMLLIGNVMTQAVIQSNTITYGNNPTGYSNGYIVLGGAYLAFQDMNTVSMFQTVRVNQGGALYYINNNLKGFSISSNHNWFVNFVFQNDGTIVVDDRLSTSAGSWKINDGSFTNTGNIMFTSSQGDTFDISATSVTNTGIIYSKGTNAARPQQLKIGNNANNWYNTGTICLANTTFDLQKSIQGVGCVSVGANSVFNIHDINLQQQSIYLSDPTSVVAVSNGQNMPVSGFGNGNGFLFPLFPIKSFNYDYLTGIVTFTVGYLGLQSFTIPIGKGYNQTLFEIVPDNYIQGNHYKNSFFIYKGSPPQAQPSICQPCVEIPLYTFKVPDAYETTNELGFSETISFYSTYNSDNLPLIGTTTFYTPPPVYTVTRSDNTTTETEIVSRVVAVDVNGSPVTYYTTIIVRPTQPSVVTTTITTTFSDGRESTITTVETANNTMSNPTSISSQPSNMNSNNMTSSAIDDGKDRTTVVTNADGSVQTDIVSHITTTDSNGKPTTIVTTVPSPAPGSVDTTVVTKSDGSVQTDIVSHITTTDASGNPTTIATTYPSPADDGKDRTTVVTNADGSVQTDIVSHITTTDSNGKPTTIVTTVPSPAPGSVDTTVVTKSDGSVQTDIVSHITTTDASGNPTTIATTYPSPADDGKDRTTVVTNADGSVQTDIVSHITTTDSNGKPTTIVTTVPSPAPGSVDTTVVTKSDGSVQTDIVSHITTTDASGNPTTIATTYPSPADDGKDRTTVVTNADGSVQTDIVSHITTTDSNGKPTTIVTTVPSPAPGSVDTTVVTKSDGSVQTDIVSHITTTDASGNPTTIATTYPSPADDGRTEPLWSRTLTAGPDRHCSHITTTDARVTQPRLQPPTSPADDGKDRTTVVTNADGSVQTDIVSHITTTDSKASLPPLSPLFQPLLALLTPLW